MNNNRRDMFAVAALQGLLASGDDIPASTAVRVAIEHADVLIVQLDRAAAPTPSTVALSSYDVIGRERVTRIAVQLIAESVPFQLTPLPDERWEFEVEDTKIDRLAEIAGQPLVQPVYHAYRPCSGCVHFKKLTTEEPCTTCIGDPDNSHPKFEPRP